MADTSTEITSTQIDRALELYYDRRIDLEGLCRLVARLGQEGPAADVQTAAQGLGLLVHERQTVQVSTERIPTSRVEAQAADASAPDEPAARQSPDLTRDLSSPQVASPDANLMKTSPGLPAIEAAAPTDETIDEDDAPGSEGGHADDDEDTSDQDSGAGEDERKRTVMVGTPRASLHSTDEPAAASATQTTPLQSFCLSRRVLPRVGPPGLSPESPSLDAPGDLHYAWGQQLGFGGVGRVNMAVDRDLRRTVAVKTLRTESAEDPIQVQAFIEEAIVTGGLVHPNIVPVYSLGYSEEHGPYYAMKRLEGEPLAHIVRRVHAEDPVYTERWGLFRLLDCFIEILQAIAFAHDHGVIHCDLKPANVIVGDYGEVTVVDWGLARVLGKRGHGQARALLTSGTPAYMPPEQAVGEVRDLDEQSDIWSLGAILYEILTGTVPYEARTSEQTIIKLLADPVDPPAERAPQASIPAPLEQACMRALAKDKLSRYPSVREMLAEVLDYVEGVRERRRREEIAEQSLDEVERFLSRLGDAEQHVDELQEQLLGGATSDDAQHALTDARDDLVFGYTDATLALERGHTAITDYPRLQEAIGDLYWRVFGRLYPARVPPQEQIREQGMGLLQRLGQMGFAAIVRTGRRHAGPDDHTESRLGRVAEDDPWLDAVLSFCGDALDYDAERAPGAMAPLVRRIAFLKAVPLFGAMAGSDLLPIAEACERHDYGPGHTIFAQGDFGDALYVVMSGRVDIVVGGNVVNTVGATECFGEIAVLDEAPRTAGAVCADAVSCLRLTAERFRHIVRDHGDIGLSVIAVLTRRLRGATEREADLRHSLDGSS